MHVSSDIFCCIIFGLREVVLIGYFADVEQANLEHGMHDHKFRLTRHRVISNLFCYVALAESMRQYEVDSEKQKKGIDTRLLEVRRFRTLTLCSHRIFVLGCVLGY